MMKRAGMSILIIFLAAFLAPAAEKKPVKPSTKDKCPVCGMFVAKYPDFLAQVIFKDGSYVVFDGTKDMFKYYFNIKKYTPSKKPPDIDVDLCHGLLQSSSGRWAQGLLCGGK